MKKEKILIRKGISDLKPYVPGKPIEDVKRELGLKEVIKLASNETSIGPSPLAIEAIIKEAKNINLYPEATSRLLREKLAEKLKIDKEMIICGNGADDVIDLVGMAFINEGDEVITCETTFPAYRTAVKIMGGKFISVKLKDFCFDLEEIAKRINEKTKMIFLCNPNNPTGTILTKEEINRFMKKIPKDIIVVFDEAYCDYVENKNYVNGLQFVLEGKNVIVVRTFSKIAGIAGVRVGYAIAHQELISYLRRVVNPFTTNRLAQVAALASLDDEEHRKKVLNSNHEGKEYLYKALDKLGLFYVPSETNFIFIDLKEDSEIVFEKLLKKGVIIRPGKPYGCPNFIRVTIGIAYENQRFIRSIKQIKNIED